MKKMETLGFYFYELNVIYEIIYRVAAKNVMKQCFSNTQSH